MLFCLFACMCAVQHATRGTGKRAYKLDKRQYCLFCGKGFLALPRHILSIHKNEKESVALAMLRETNIKEYIVECKRLQNIGNFKYNVQVLKSGGTNIVVAKRPSKLRKVSDFTPCPSCLGFYCKAEMWRHAKKCPSKPAFSDSKSLISRSKILLMSALEEKLSPCMKMVQESMQDDNLKTIILKDTLLLQFGEVLVKKYGVHKKNDINQRLRQLARVKEECKKGASVHCFMDLLSGTHYDKVHEATDRLCGKFVSPDGRNFYKIPSLALRLGHLLRKLACVKQGFCLRTSDIDGYKQAETFLALMKNEWTDAVSTNALNTLRRRKDNTPENLPLTDDLLKVKNFITDALPKLVAKLQCDKNYTAWRQLAQMIIARLIIFNKRRPAEVSKLLLNAFQNRPKWKDVNTDEVTKNLADLEKKFLDRLDLVMVPGKRSRKVPILICPDAAEPLKILVETRATVGIPEKNPFVFASLSLNGSLDGWQAVNAITSQVKLQKPELITSTRCRKYGATITQLFDLTPNEQEWLANHYGHHMDIEKDFYRIHESTIEITKVGRLLMKIDSGGNSDCDEEKDCPIPATDKEKANYEEDKNDGKCVSVESEQDILQSYANECSVQAQECKDTSSESSGEEVIFKPKPSSRKRKIISSESESTPQKKSESTPQKKSHLRTKWTSKEEEILLKSFQHLLKQKLYPSTMQIRSMQQELMKKRSPAQIRSKLQSLMKRFE